MDGIEIIIKCKPELEGFANGLRDANELGGIKTTVEIQSPQGQALPLSSKDGTKCWRCDGTGKLQSHYNVNKYEKCIVCDGSGILKAKDEVVGEARGMCSTCAIDGDCSIQKQYRYTPTYKCAGHRPKLSKPESSEKVMEYTCSTHPNLKHSESIAKIFDYRCKLCGGKLEKQPPESSGQYRPRMFPVQDGEDITWELAKKVYEGYAKEFPSSASEQSLKRIGERGGWGVHEVNRYLGEASPFKQPEKKQKDQINK